MPSYDPTRSFAPGPLSSEFRLNRTFPQWTVPTNLGQPANFPTRLRRQPFRDVGQPMSPPGKVPVNILRHD
jgi:hypothetical protein